MKKYKVVRKYPTEQFGNMDFEARGLENREDISKELEYFDAVAKEYLAKKELEKAKCCDSYPSCSCQRPIKQGEKVPKKTFPF